VKAMILAAGKGTRVRPLTNKIPKPMIPIVTKPTIEFLIELLKNHDVTEIMINISHLGWLIQDYLRNGSKYGVNIGYSFEGKLLPDGTLETEPIGSAGGMKLIQERYNFFDETFIVLCGDAIVDLDITEAYNFHKSKGALATIITKEVSKDQVSNYGIVVTDEKGKVLSFQEKPSSEEAKSNIANTGIYIFEPEIFEHIPSGEFYDIGSQLFPKLVSEGKPIYAYSMDFNWFDIGRNKDYLVILEKALSGEIKNFYPGGKEIYPGVWVGTGAVISQGVEIKPPVYIGSSTILEKGVTITGPAIIGANCYISKDSHIANAFVMDYCYLKPGTSLSRILVTPEYFVHSDGESGEISESHLSKSVKDVRTLGIEMKEA